MGIAVLLATIFGPAGTLFSTKRGAAVMLMLALGAVGVGVPTSAGVTLILLGCMWLASIEWAAAVAAALPVLSPLRKGRWQAPGRGAVGLHGDPGGECV